MIDLGSARPLRRDCGEAFHAALSPNIVFNALTKLGRFHEAIFIILAAPNKTKHLSSQHQRATHLSRGKGEQGVSRSAVVWTANTALPGALLERAGSLQPVAIMALHERTAGFGGSN